MISVLPWLTLVYFQYSYNINEHRYSNYGLGRERIEDGN